MADHFGESALMDKKAEEMYMELIEIKKGNGRSGPQLESLSKFYGKHGIRPNETSVLHMIVCDQKALETAAKDPYYRENVRNAIRVMARAFHGVKIPQQKQLQLARV